MTPAGASCVLQTHRYSTPRARASWPSKFHILYHILSVLTFHHPKSERTIFRISCIVTQIGCIRAIYNSRVGNECFLTCSI
jgi:hypothetical protein